MALYFPFLKDYCDYWVEGTVLFSKIEGRPTKKIKITSIFRIFLDFARDSHIRRTILLRSARENILGRPTFSRNFCVRREKVIGFVELVCLVFRRGICFSTSDRHFRSSPIPNPQTARAIPTR